MRIALLSHNPRQNYGGILQSYALKKVLERMGHNVQVICRQRSFPEYGIEQIIRWPYRVIKKITGRKDVWIFMEHHINEIDANKYQHTDRFVDTYLNPRFVRSLKDIREGEFDAFIVGSDQVWRPKYMKFMFGRTRIEDIFLNFAKNWTIKRIAYAASFGVDTWEYTNKETIECAQLLKKFDSVSVREISGVKLCKDYFGVDAIQVSDPTLLLPKEDYISICKGSKPLGPNKLLVYCLDNNKELDNLAEIISKEKGLEPFYLINGLDKQKVLRPVETWLRGFMDAEFVVTDSFHGCIFSIIFNKPFVSLGNSGRGATRFSSIMQNLGLDKNFIYSTTQFSPEVNYSIPVDSYVRLTKYKDESYTFLQRAINNENYK